MSGNELDSSSSSRIDKHADPVRHGRNMLVKRIEWSMLAGSLLLGAIFLIVIAFE